MNLISFEAPSDSKANGARSTAPTCFHGHLDLSLGISSSSHGNCTSSGHVGCVSSGATAPGSPVAGGGGRDGGIGAGNWAAFMPNPTGFMHPWSLAARQQKAAAEQRRDVARAAPAAAVYAPSRAPCIVPLSSAVGWPPVHTCRRNLATTHAPKSSAAGAADAEEGAKGGVGGNAGEEGASRKAEEMRACMFAKVHMEGHLIGRKVNLRAHGSYDALSRVLRKMAVNFLCPADSSAPSEEQSASEGNFIFLYEDFEGDRMLVGDVPWELFLASVRRLYIARNPTSQDRANGGITKDLSDDVEAAK